MKNYFQSLLILVCFLVAGFVSTTAKSEERLRLTKLKKCNKSFTKCIVDSRRLTIGDKVGLFSEGGMVVAEGRVKSIKNGWRYIDIIKSHGKRSRVSYVDLWRSKKEYISYKESSNFSVGFHANYGRYNNESLMNIFELGIFAEWKNEFLGLGLGDYFGVVARMNFYSGGDVFTPNLDQTVVEYTYGTTVVGGLVGLSFNPFQNSTISPRVEVSGGYGIGSETLNPGTLPPGQEPFDIRIQAGGNILFVTQGSLVMNLGQWHPNVGASISLIGESWGRSMHIGLIYDL